MQEPSLFVVMFYIQLNAEFIPFSCYIQIYIKRSKFTKTEKEKKRWAELSWEFMTEGSDSESSNIIRQHAVPWLSRSMSNNMIVVGSII